MVNVLIPSWFFGWHAMAYIVSALIGFLVSFYSYRIYHMTKEQNHLYLYLGFAALSMAFLIFGVVELYSYLSISQNMMQMFESFSSFRDFGIWLYYIGSIIAYLLIAFTYVPKKYRFAPLFLPMWWKGFPYFHVGSLFILSFIIFRATGNWFIKKTINSMLVFMSFLLIGFYHIFLFFTPFSEWMFVLAHISLIAGFLSFLIMLIRVSKKAGRR